jgi:hypothetical protein
MERGVHLEGPNQNSQKIIVFRKGASNQRNVTGPNCFVNTTAEIGVLRRSSVPVVEFRGLRQTKYAVSYYGNNLFPVTS